MHSTRRGANLRGVETPGTPKPLLGCAMIETIGFILFLLAILFVAMGSKRPDKKDDEKKPGKNDGPKSPDG